jgi:Leucine-rich repeat (LRR) protein
LRKIEELFETLSDPQLIIDGLNTIETEAINKYWLSGKLQQPRYEDAGKSDVKRLLLIAFAPENTLPAMQRYAPRLRTAPAYTSDFSSYRNQENFEPEETLTITQDFDVLPLCFYPLIYEALQTKVIRIASDAYVSHFSTGKLNWLKGIKKVELRGSFWGYSKKLENLPDDIGVLQDLEELTINYTEISTLPDGLFDLKSLKKLDLKRNKLISMSNRINQLEELEYLDVCMNNLTCVPDSLNKLKKLKEIVVFDNPFKEITDCIAFHTYRYNYTFDDSYKSYVELIYPKEVLVINKSWLDVPLCRIEEIITTHQIKKLRVESVAMLNRILMPDAAGHFKDITSLDLQWNVWESYDYQHGFFKDMHFKTNIPSNDEAKIKELPEGLGLMTWLEEVNLHGNKIEVLPESFFNLKNLKKLNLNGNRIAVLPDLFASLSELTHMNLGSMEFSVIPDSIYSLKKLVHLDLSWNRNIAELSPKVGKLTNLEELYLKDNLLNELPKEFTNLTKLKKLTLNQNEFTVFPESLLNLSELEELNIGGQKITEFPNNLSGLSKLKHLNFEGAELQTVSEAIGELKNIEVLNFKQNKITSISEEIKQCSQLKNLNLEQNKLLDKLPQSIGDITKLESIHLYQCEMIQSLPASISNLSNLKILDLSYTVISELPASIFELTSLVELKLFYLPITTLTSEIKNLVNLEYLDLRLTKITELPGEIGNLQKLTKLDGAKFNKALPDSFCNLINLKELDIDFENVEKPLPENFGNLVNLESFDPGDGLDYLPASFGKLINLKRLTIRKSKFREFPLVLTELKNIGHLDLMYNQFTDVPYELTKLKSLYLIRFDDNPLGLSNSIQKKCKALLPGVEFAF